MVKIRAFDGLTFKPELYDSILSKNMEYLGDCELLRTFNTQDFLSKGLLEPENQQFVYLYEQQFLGFTTLGLMAELSLLDYEQKRIKKHEQTLVRAHLNEQTYAQNHVGPVIVGHEHLNAIDDLLHHLKDSLEPFAKWATVDGRRHRLWRVAELEQLLDCFEAIQSLYILDGHHRFQAALEHLKKIGENAKDKHYWIQGLVYSTKYIRTYPQFRELTHSDNSSIIRNLMTNQKLSFQKIDTYDGNDQDAELVLLYDGKLYKLDYQRADAKGKEKHGVELLDEILKEAFTSIGRERTSDCIKFVPSILFDMKKAESCKRPVFLVKSPAVETIFEFADQGLVLPPKSTWLEPKPCLHMVIRLPY